MNTRRYLATYLASLVASVLVGASLVYGVTPPLRNALRACEAVAAVTVLPIILLLSGQLRSRAPIWIFLPILGVLLSAIFLAYGIRRAQPRAIFTAMAIVAAAIISGAIWLRGFAPAVYDG